MKKTKILKAIILGIIVFLLGIIQMILQAETLAIQQLLQKAN